MKLAALLFLSSEGVNQAPGRPQDARGASRIDELVARHSPQMRTIEVALLGVLRAEMPDAVVAFSPWHGGAITIGRSPRMRDRAFALLAHTSYVNLWLWDGARLPDPTGIVTGAGAKIRHVSVRDLAQARSTALRDIVRAQVAALATLRRTA